MSPMVLAGIQIALCAR